MDQEAADKKRKELEEKLDLINEEKSKKMVLNELLIFIIRKKISILLLKLETNG